MEKEYHHSYINSRKILSRSCEIHRTHQELARRMITDNVAESIRRTNELLFKTAQEKGISLYELCFNTVPDYTIDPHFNPLDGVSELRQTIILRPAKLNLEQGGGYWKAKYFRLKDRLQEIVNNKDD